jgi:hypothetical protein
MNISQREYCKMHGMTADKFIGCKNYLFAGNDKLAENAVMIYSFFANCRNHNVNPFEWLTDVFSKIIDYKNSKLAELLPMNWKNSQN